LLLTVYGNYAFSHIMLTVQLMLALALVFRDTHIDVRPHCSHSCTIVLVCRWRTVNDADIFYWDATALPLKDNSVDVFVSDMVR